MALYLHNPAHGPIQLTPRKAFSSRAVQSTLHATHMFCLHFVTLFMHFLELTYWQDATVSVPVFCCFCISEKLYRKYSRNWTKQKPKFLISRNEDGVRSRDEGEPQGGHTTPRRGQTWARAWAMSGPLRGLQHFIFWLRLLLGKIRSSYLFRLIPRIFPVQLFWNQKQQKTGTGTAASRQ